MIRFAGLQKAILFLLLSAKYLHLAIPVGDLRYHGDIARNVVRDG